MSRQVSSDEPYSAEPLMSAASGQLWSTEMDRALKILVAVDAANEGVASFPRVAAAINQMFGSNITWQQARDRAEASDSVPASSLPPKAAALSEPGVQPEGSAAEKTPDDGCRARIISKHDALIAIDAQIENIDIETNELQAQNELLEKYLENVLLEAQEKPA